MEEEKSGDLKTHGCGLVDGVFQIQSRWIEFWRWAGATGAHARAVRDSQEFSVSRRGDEWLQGFAGDGGSGDIPAHPIPRISFHSASPAVELTHGDSFDGSLGADSGNQYSHWPWSLHIRPCSLP